MSIKFKTTCKFYTVFFKKVVVLQVPFFGR